MTSRDQYIAMLTEAYRWANLSDTDRALDWQMPSDSAVHCRAIETILRDMMTGPEYQEWLDNL